jgi:hypothetical protein
MVKGHDGLEACEQGHEHESVAFPLYFSGIDSVGAMGVDSTKQIHSVLTPVPDSIVVPQG